MNFSDISAVVMDMDGVLWRGDEPLPGLIPFFDLLRARHLPFALATNNSAKSQADYVVKLARMGVNHVPESSIITSGAATAEWLKLHYPPGTRVHVLGGDGLRDVLSKAGFVMVDQDAQVVVSGADFDLTYQKLRRATSLIRAGAAFVGTNPDPTYPMPDGLAPGAGSILAALITATGCQPVIIGKPETPMFEMALRTLGAPADRTLMIGDRLTTDILGAKKAGLRTALVLTGVTTRADLAASDTQPDAVFEGLPALTEALSGH